MTWFKVCDGLHDHRKVRRAGTASMGLWLLCGAWSAANLSDGFIPADIAARYGTARQAAKLGAVGLWEPAERDGEGGWLFHDWPDYQPSRDEVESKRAAAAQRQAKARSLRHNNGTSEDSVTRDTLPGSGVSHTAPVPARPDPSTHLGREGVSTSPRDPGDYGAHPMITTSPGSTAPAPRPGPAETRLAASLVAEHVPAQPQRVAGRLSIEAANLLAEGISGDQVAAGLRLWAGKRVGAGVLPEMVGEVMRAPGIAANRSRSTTDDRVAAALALAEQYAAEDARQQSGMLAGAA